MDDDQCESISSSHDINPEHTEISGFDNRKCCCICTDEVIDAKSMICETCKSIYHKECWDEAKVNCICPYCR